MEISIISIGNSKGIRLSKTILEKYKITDTVELILEEECIVIRPKTEPRKGWDTAFEAMHNNGDDKLIIDDILDNENFEEWS